MAIWKGHFDHFQSQNIRFLCFHKVFLEFRGRLGIVFILIGSLLRVFSTLMFYIWPPKSKFYFKFFSPLRGSFWPLQRLIFQVWLQIFLIFHLFLILKVLQIFLIIKINIGISGILEILREIPDIPSIADIPDNSKIWEGHFDKNNKCT